MPAEHAVKVEVETLEECKRRLAVEAPLDLVEEAWERAYGRVQKQARLPGFRKGHVPRSLVKLHFADDVRRDVAEHLIPDLYNRAVSEAKLAPITDPDLSDVQLEEGAPLSFKAVVEIKPTITLGAYRGLDIAHAPVPVAEADVDETLERMRDQHAELRSVERAAAPGDVLIVDYVLALEGLAPSSQTGYAFQVGDGSVLPEIDQAVAGMRAGEEREVGIRFADDHRREELRGKTGSARVKVVEVKEKVLAPLDDELARSLGQFDTLEALRAEVRRQLEARRASEERAALEDKVVDRLIATHQFAVPEAMMSQQVRHQIEHGRERLRRQGVDPDRIPWDYAKLAAELRPGAERAVRRMLLLEAVAGVEDVTPTEAEVEAEVAKIAEATQRPLPAVRRMMEKNGDLEALRHGLRERKTLDLLIAQASVHP
jgi:trigger factor